jgi:ribosomal protein L37AE/L43A
MKRQRLRCSSCQQFYNDRCQLGIPECRGADSIAADDCPCYLPPSGISVFLNEENESQLTLF